MKIRNRFVIRVLARGLSLTFRMLYGTNRREIVELFPDVSPYRKNSPEKFIFCNWHDGLLHALFCGQVRDMSALTSRHADGEYVAELMNAVGVTPVRGSNNHGGATAAKQLITATADQHITITTDGPRGPRRGVKPGVVFLASQTGQRIVPVGCSSVSAWKPMGKWTDLLIAKPFSTAFMVGSEPLAVPPNLRRDQLKPYLNELQRRMDAVQAHADELADAIREKRPAKPYVYHSDFLTESADAPISRAA